MAVFTGSRSCTECTLGFNATGTHHQAAETVEQARHSAEETAAEAGQQGGSAWQKIKDTVTGASHQAGETADEAQHRAQA